MNESNVVELKAPAGDALSELLKEGARQLLAQAIEAEVAELLVDEVLPEQPMRQWVLSFPFPLHFLFASRPEIMGRVLGIVYRVIATHLIKKAGLTKKSAQTGAVTLIQRFGSALNLNIHFHMLCLDVKEPLWPARLSLVGPAPRSTPARCRMVSGS